MTDIKRLIESKGFVISDGAMGTELAKRGLEAGTCPELWNVENPEAIRAVIASYVRAGSDIVLTNTFGGNRKKLAKYGLAERIGELNRRGVEIARDAAGDSALVFASVGSTGEFMAPLGTLTEADFVACFAEQIAVLVEAGVDGIVIETMTALEEALAALKAVRETASLPVVVSMTYQKGPGGLATMMGVRPEGAASSLAEADVIGANCGSGIEDMIEVARLMRGATRKPLWLKPNAGLPELVKGKTVFRETPEQMASRLGDLIEAGANVVGGCCGTTPAHIEHIARARASLADRARELAAQQFVS